ncbi:hypothetical protein [Roseibacillus persicicus]|uniref:Uncharacterized protein n=1 Tax=Roseibacillus persicicus TaxID=454148 RepID=A0A918WIS1_9BACT|nr:hypothetical protein [Roseibacillus persicicus]GHC51517.1 hypothetical protein GCM10007100_17190 [Roseibacillus persicicus]
MKSSGIAIAVTFAALTGVGGFFVGKGAGSSGGGDEEASLPTKSTLSQTTSTQSNGGTGTVQPNLRGYELSKNPRQGLETLLEELRQSPMAQMDFEALFGIWDMVQYLDAYELQSLMAELDEMGGGQEMLAVRMMLLNRWAAKDGPAAMESVFEGEKGMMQMIGATGAMLGWMRSEPDQAYAWFKENGDRLGGSAMGMGKEQIEAMYFANMAKTDFDGTMAKLDGMESKTQKAVIQQLAQSAGMDPERRSELLDYLKSKDDPDLLHDARRSIVQQMAWQDPQAAIDFIESENPRDDLRDELVDNATSMWSHTDPAGAVEWLGEELKGQPDAGEKISSSFGQWVGQDEAEAAQWLASQGDEFKTDSVFRDAGHGLINSGEYERSAEWFEQIIDDDDRRVNYDRLYQSWKEEDQAAADQWKTQLPAEEAAMISQESSVGAAVGAVIGASVGEAMEEVPAEEEE